MHPLTIRDLSRIFSYSDKLWPHFGSIPSRLFVSDVKYFVEQNSFLCKEHSLGSQIIEAASDKELGKQKTVGRM